jgi:hypothetical protein
LLDFKRSSASGTAFAQNPVNELQYSASCCSALSSSNPAQSGPNIMAVLLWFALRSLHDAIDRMLLAARKLGGKQSLQLLQNGL